MSVFRCHFCHRPVQWMNTKFAKRMLFEATLLAADLDLDEAGWIPGTWKVGHANRKVMAPIKHYGRDKRQRVRYVVLLHACTVLAEESA